MKTSNSIIAATVAVCVAGLFLNAFQLKKMYLVTDWEDLYRDCVKQEIPNVQALYFEVMDNAEGWQSETITILRGDRYLFATPDTSLVELIPTDSGLVVRSKTMHLKAFVILPELVLVEAVNRENVLIDGFDCDTLTLRADAQANIRLKCCHINCLSVQSVGGRVEIHDNNTVADAEVRLRNGEFYADDIACHTLTFDADTTSSVTLRGRSIIHAANR
ncbi:MAG: hypothetical protein LBT78_05515 [Tannerella sp.]|jgi:hypothetical protein|nr:hypothetical protein [Tannerella sp.]